MGDPQETVDDRIQYPYYTEVDDRRVSLRRLGEYERCDQDRQANMSAQKVDGEEDRGQIPQVRRQIVCDRC